MSRTRRRALALTALLAAALVVLGVLLVRDVRTARRSLEAARSTVQAVQQAVLAGDRAAAEAGVRRLQQETAAARASTDGVLWRLAAAFPYLGRTPGVVRTDTAALAGLAQGVLPEVVSVAGSLSSDRLLPGGSQVALAPLRDARASLQRAAARSAAVRATLAALPSAGVLDVVGRGSDELRRRVDQLDQQLQQAARAATLLPSMLGGNGPRHYLLALQNNAEARGTGGLMGAFGVLEADHGVIRLVRTGAVEDLRSARTLPVDLGAAYRRLYGDDPALWGNSNESPNFPYAARLWLALWEQQTGKRLDGVLATDPVALGYLLGAIGPVTLPNGQRVSAGNAVDLTERDAYATYAHDIAGRKAFLGTLTRAVADRLLGPGVDVHAALTALGRAAGEHRLLLYSAHPDEQALLAGTPLAGLLPDAAGPFAALVVDNAAGNKLDFYLERRLDYVVGACRDGARPSRVTVTLRNAAPAGGLPAYVTLRGDRPSGGAPVGSTRLLVYLFLARGAGVTSATVDGGHRVSFVAGSERGRPVVELPLTLLPGQSRRLRLDLAEPAVGGPARVWVQPLARAQQTHTSVATCG